MNSCQFMGNLTRDPELKDVGNTKVCNFGIAINRTYKNRDGEQQTETCFLDCEAWAGTGEIIERWFEKGKPIIVQGSLKLETWDTENGKRSKHKLRVEQFHFLPRNNGDETSNNASGSGGQVNDSDAEDIPF